MIRHEIWGYCIPHFRQTYVTVRIYVQRFGCVRKILAQFDHPHDFVHRIHHWSCNLEASATFWTEISVDLLDSSTGWTLLVWCELFLCGWQSQWHLESKLHLQKKKKKPFQPHRLDTQILGHVKYHVLSCVIHNMPYIWCSYFMKLSMMFPCWLQKFPWDTDSNQDPSWSPRKEWKIVWSSYRCCWASWSGRPVSGNARGTGFWSSVVSSWSKISNTKFGEIWWIIQ